jgi:3-hydroxyacyl-CoA dehydrogenase/enoyl-CoA hydratase/3-hydroxybutyryl-CoA epimerase
MSDKNLKTLSSGKAVKLSILNNGIAVLTLDLEDSKVNKLSTPVMAELDAAFELLAKQSGVRGLVINSGKRDMFVAGADLDEVSKIQKMSPTVSFQATEHGKAVFAKLEALPFPTVAAVDGTCLGGGTELTLACTYRLASDNPKTKFGLPEVGLGFIPGWGGSVRLPRLIGVQSALELILQPLKTWDAQKAWRTGMASEVVPADKLMERAIAVASGARPKTAKQPLKARAMRTALEKNWVAAVALTLVGALAGGIVGGVVGGLYGLIFSHFLSAAATASCWTSAALALLGAVAGSVYPFGRNQLRKGATAMVMKETKGNYPAPLQAIKVAMAAIEGSPERAYKMESVAFGNLCTGAVSQNMVRLFHLTQGAKKLPAELLPKKVGVLGCGTMGAGIVQLTALSGFKVVARDPYPGAIERGQATVKGLFDKLVEKKVLSADEAAKLFGNITFVKDETAPLADCDLIIEAVIEEVAAKQTVYRELEKVLAGRKCVIATNTSSLRVTTLGSCLADQSRFGGLHFFNPVHAMKFVEVIRGDQTSDETADTLQVFATKLNKVTRAFKDRPLFVVNRILAPVMNEVMQLLESGVPAEDIEKAMTKFGMPMGPLTLMDEVGLDICANVLREANAAFGARVSQSSLFAFFKANKLTGKKGGKGFFLYDEKGKAKGLNPELVAQLPKKSVTKKIEEIQDRLVLAMVNEAIRCMEEGIASDADDLNLAMILGTGWAPFRGGPLRYADSLGSRTLLQKLDTLYAATGDENYKPANLLRRMAASGETFCR